MHHRYISEPPESDESERVRFEKMVKPIRVADTEISIHMLEQHLDAEKIKPMITALEGLKAETDNESCLVNWLWPSTTCVHDKTLV